MAKSNRVMKEDAAAYNRRVAQMLADDPQATAFRKAIHKYGPIINDPKIKKDSATYIFAVCQLYRAALEFKENLGKR